MAEEDKTEQRADGGDAPRERKGLYRILLLVGVIAIAGGAGFGAAVMLGGSGGVGPDEDDSPNPAGTKDEYEYLLEFPPVTVNLDVPNANRYVRTTLALAVKKGKKAEIEKIVLDHTPQLTNVLTVYLSSLTLDDVLGKDDLNKIRREIKEKFNEELWGGGRPRIREVLLIEFKVQ